MGTLSEDGEVMCRNEIQNWLWCIAVCESTHLCIDSEVWIPPIRRDNLANAKVFCLRSNLPDIFHRVLEFLLRGAIRRRLLQAMRSRRFVKVWHLRRMASSLHSVEVERLSMAR